MKRQSLSSAITRGTEIIPTLKPGRPRHCRTCASISKWQRSFRKSMPVHAGAPVKETFRVEAASQDQNEPRGKKPGLLAAASGFLALSAAQGMKNSRRAERSKRHRQPVFKEACCKHVFTRRDMALRLLELYRCWCGTCFCIRDIKEIVDRKRRIEPAGTWRAVPLERDRAKPKMRRSICFAYSSFLT